MRRQKIPTPLGTLLFDTRLCLGLTHRQVEEMSGVASATVRQVEDGYIGRRGTSFLTAVLLSRSYGLDLEALADLSFSKEIARIKFQGGTDGREEEG